MISTDEITAVLAEHQQCFSSCGPEDDCMCGARLSSSHAADIAEHQATMLAPVLANINRREIAEEVVRINQEAMLIHNRRAIEEELARGPLQFEKRTFDWERTR